MIIVRYNYMKIIYEFMKNKVFVLKNKVKSIVSLFRNLSQLSLASSTDLYVALRESFDKLHPSWNYSNKIFVYANTSYKLWTIFEFAGQFSSNYSIIDSLWMAMGFEIT